jgi:SAM-dependent methyltransferase
VDKASCAGKRLLEHQSVWRTKPVLRAIYADLFQRVGDWLVPGTTVELGAGTGNFKEFLPSCLAVDIQFAPWLDVAADAHALPFVDGSLCNLVLVDVLHHLAEPRRFLLEAQRVLVPGGRVAMIEPAVTPVSWFFYRLFHSERLDFSIDPLADCDEKSRSDPYDGNQALATLLFDRQCERLQNVTPLLRIEHKTLLSLVAYPLSGGFRSWSLVPERAVSRLLKLERWMLPVVGKWMAFRMLVVLQRIAAPESASR